MLAWRHNQISTELNPSTRNFSSSSGFPEPLPTGDFDDETAILESIQDLADLRRRGFERNGAINAASDRPFQVSGSDRRPSGPSDQDRQGGAAPSALMPARLPSLLGDLGVLAITRKHAKI
ncbi:hypothetical protein [Sedimentitalea sp.]|uniref:hypothetical protein n=1 Tax=Sedimentitalea sp. TaxID=2048915 RepID=UPI003299ABEB